MTTAFGNRIERYQVRDMQPSACPRCGMDSHLMVFRRVVTRKGIKLLGITLRREESDLVCNLCAKRTA